MFALPGHTRGIPPECREALVDVDLTGVGVEVGGGFVFSEC